MSLDKLDPLLSTPKKLAAIGMLSNVAKVEFAFMREHLNLSDSDLSKQMSALVDAGYVTSRKSGRGSGRKTWFSITAAGKRALNSHLDALNALVLETLPGS
jgi:DNA-binding MarR family transcriptional regulator